MPNLTPPRYRKLYQIYPGKVFNCEGDDSERLRVESLIRKQRRRIGKGRGDSLNYIRRMQGQIGIGVRR